MNQRSRSQINVDNVKIYTTPRKLISSLQEPNSSNSEASEQQSSRMFRSPCRSKLELSPISSSKYDEDCLSRQHPAAIYDQYGFLRNVNHEQKSNEDVLLNNEDHGSSESVYSSEYVHAVADVQQQASQDLALKTKTELLKTDVEKGYPMSVRSMVCSIFALILGIFVCLFWIGSEQDEGYNLLPT